MDEVKIFIGVDPRQPIAYHVLCDSIMWRASKRVAITPLRLNTLPIKRRGLTEFTFSRFLVPHLCDYKGSAIFMDADILVTGDIAELIDCAQVASYDVQVMQDQPRFEWPSVMLFNNARCRKLTPEWIENAENNPYALESWAKAIGPLPAQWNSCVYAETPEANLHHFTQGVPCWPETRGNWPAQDEMWVKQHRHMNASVPWRELMGTSVHAKSTMDAYKARTEAA